MQIESIYHTTNNAGVSAPKSRSSSESSSLLPPVQITPDRAAAPSIDERLEDGLNIERPRSALHTGDFTLDEAARQRRPSDAQAGRREDRLSAEAEWLATSPPRHFTPSFHFERRIPFNDSASSYKSTASPLSSSLSSSFAYQPPTSPLAQSITNDDIDFGSQFRDSRFLSDRMDGSRRSTLGFDTSSPFTSPSRGSRLSGTPTFRRESAFPYQAHQPRRSLNSTPNIVLPQTPRSTHSRRPSLGSDSSPLQHASMVGSYEESILRGRMSTNPSKPFDFLAQIGVLGKGKCKSSLRCPAHVTLPFPAVYYSYSNTSHGRSQTNDGPSPYVGQVDLENGLPNQEEDARMKRKLQSRYAEQASTADHMDIDMVDGPEPPVQESRIPKRRTSSPKAPPGGSYRIPEKGQIQIVVKNQNKTAVKLFLVPYDLTGMTAGTKTFIRQRSYSQGPIIENVPNLSEADAMGRPTLRYLVHLHICCPSKGRFYLYKSIRIVFANRVPEGKEKLRNDTTWPEPRFTPYKPTKHPPVSTGPGAMLAVDKAYRRRSLGVPMGASSHRPSLSTEGIPQPTRRSDLDPPSSFASGNTLPIDPIPFRLPTSDRLDSDMSDSISNLRSPGSSSQTSRPSTKDSAGLSPWGGGHQYEKLNKGDFGYGGNAFGIIDHASPGTAEGLLSQRLRSLGVDQRGWTVHRPTPPPPEE